MMVHANHRVIVAMGPIRSLVMALTDTPSTQYFDREPVLKMETHLERTWHM